MKQDKYDHFQKIGDRVIYKEKQQSVIVIVNNRGKLKTSSLGFFLAGPLFIGFMLFSSSNINEGAIIISSLLLAPFLLVGLGYYIRSRKKQTLEFQLKRKAIVFDNKRTIAFSQISEFTLTKLQTASPSGGSYSYQLNFETVNGKEFTLFSDSDFTQILLAGEFLNKFTSIFLNRKVEFA